MKTNLSLVKGFASSLCVAAFFLFAAGSAIAQTSTPTVRYSDKVIDRPSVMPVGIVNLDTGVVFTGLNATNLSLASQFGIVDKLQGEVSFAGVYPFKPTKEIVATNLLTLGTKYNYYNIDHVSFSFAAHLPMHILGGEIVRDVTLGLPTVFYNHMMAGGILHNLFTLSMRPDMGFGMNFPIWFGVQAYGKLWLQIDSSFGGFHMVNKDKQSTWVHAPFWKSLPAKLSGTYVINHNLDVGAAFGFGDLMKAKDTIEFGVNFSIRGGRIFG